MFFFFQNKGVAMGNKVDYKTTIGEKLKKVNISDGVSKEEAIIIAQNYILEEEINVNDLNFLKPKISEKALVKGCWEVIFNARFKVKMDSGLKWFRINVDKETGEIKSWGWGPS